MKEIMLDHPDSEVKTWWVAMPSKYKPEGDTAFMDWCEYNNIDCRFTRWEAWDERYRPYYQQCQNGCWCWSIPPGYYLQPVYDYFIWAIEGTVADAVAVKLMWGEEMGEKWFLPKFQEMLASYMEDYMDNRI